jgi:hypothetical protein
MISPEEADKAQKAVRKQVNEGPSHNNSSAVPPPPSAANARNTAEKKKRNADYFSKRVAQTFEEIKKSFSSEREARAQAVATIQKEMEDDETLAQKAKEMADEYNMARATKAAKNAAARGAAKEAAEGSGGSSGGRRRTKKRSQRKRSKACKSRRRR